MRTTTDTYARKPFRWNETVHIAAPLDLMTPARITARAFVHLDPSRVPLPLLVKLNPGLTAEQITERLAAVDLAARMKEAERLGRAAYAREDATRAPALDEDCWPLVDDLRVGNGAADVWAAWLTGWDAAADEAAAAVLAEPEPAALAEPAAPSLRAWRRTDPPEVWPCACCGAAVVERTDLPGYPIRNADDLSEHVVPLHSPEQDPALGCN